MLCEFRCKVDINRCVLFPVLFHYGCHRILETVPCVYSRSSFLIHPVDDSPRRDSQTPSPSLPACPALCNHKFAPVSVTRFMFHGQVHLCGMLGPTYMWRETSVSLGLTSLHTVISRSIHVAANGTFQLFLWLRNLLDVDGHLGCFYCLLLVLMWSQAWPNAVSPSWGEEVIESGWYCLSHSRLWAWSEPSKLETWPRGWRFFGPRAWIPIHWEWPSSAAQGSAWKPQNQCRALTRRRPEGSRWLGGGRVALELFHAGRDSALSGLALTRFLVLGGLSWL